MRVVTDLDALRRPCGPVKSVMEGGEIARKLTAALRQHNGHALRAHRKTGGKTELVRGVGLAANQLGIQKQVCVILQGDRPVVLMNPRVVACSDQKIGFVEGCLSMPGVKVETSRHWWVQVETINASKSWRFGPGGLDRLNPNDLLMAVAVQHEVAHLFGLTIQDFGELGGNPHPLTWGKKERA